MALSPDPPARYEGWSDADLVRAMSRKSASQGALAELTRRHAEATRDHAAQMKESDERLKRLTKVIVWLTVVIVFLALAQIGIALGLALLWLSPTAVKPGGHCPESSRLMTTTEASAAGQTPKRPPAGRGASGVTASIGAPDGSCHWRVRQSTHAYMRRVCPCRR